MFHKLRRVMWGGVLAMAVGGLVVTIAPTTAVYAGDFDSFSICTNRKELKKKNIYSNSGKYLGYVRVYTCNEGFFAHVTNQVGYPGWTIVEIKRYNGVKPYNYDTSGGKYSSITDMLGGYKGSWYYARGYISTTQYGSANGYIYWQSTTNNR